MMVGIGAAAFASEGKLDERAIRLMDRDTQKMYRFYDVKGIHLLPSPGKTEAQAYQTVKKQVDALAKEKNPPLLKGNPASFYCSDRLKGKNLNLVDLAQNEYAICRLPDGTLVDAWDVFRLQKK